MKLKEMLQMCLKQVKDDEREEAPLPVARDPENAGAPLRWQRLDPRADRL